MPDRFEVDYAKPLAGLSTAGATAYAAQDRERPQDRIYALVQRHDVPLRGKVLEVLTRRPIRGLLNPLWTGLAPVREGTGEAARRVTITQAPAGPALVGDWKKSSGSVDRFLRTTFLTGAIEALLPLHEQNLAHRGIRPDNIYLSDSSESGIVFGECFSAPPGVSQPDSFETLARTTADPAGRGSGDPASDMFALGVALLSIFTGSVPGDGRSRSELYHARVAQGSFWAYVGGRELPGSMATLTRNLLNDDPAERWTLRDLAFWLGGQAHRKPVGFSDWSLSRPVRFQGNSYSDRRLLAEALAADVPAATQFLRHAEYPDWVRQAVASENLTDRLERQLDPGKSRVDENGADHSLVALYATYLDPFGPIRFKGVTVPADGIGAALADAFAKADKARQQALGELISSGLAIQLIEISETRNPDVAKSYARFAPLVHLTRSKAPGQGVERALYTLNPHLPCQGERFRPFWADNIRSAMRALDVTMAGGAQAGEVFDQHFLAFCASRAPELDGVFGRLSAVAGNPAAAIPTTLEIVAYLQLNFKSGPLPNLAKRLAGNLVQLVEKLKHRGRREEVSAAIRELAGAGDVALLAGTLGLSRLQAQDQEEFARAQTHFRQFDAERRRLEDGVKHTDPGAMALGAQIGVALGALALGLSSLMFVWGF